MAHAQGEAAFDVRGLGDFFGERLEQGVAASGNISFGALIRLRENCSTSLIVAPSECELKAFFSGRRPIERRFARRHRVDATTSPM